MFPRSAGSDIGFYASEAAPEWVYFLDADQHALADEYLERLFDAVVKGHEWTGIISGGPGTGKTAVLVWLLNEIRQLFRNDYDLAFVASHAMRDYVEAGTSWDLEAVWQSHHELAWRADLVLVDDPETLPWVESSVSLARASGKARVVVVAVDPLQCSETVADADFERFSASLEADVGWLTTCYRQKEEVGRAAMTVAAVVASSSPFLNENKKKAFAAGQRELVARVNGTRFINPTGIVVTSDQPPVWADHLAMLQRHQQQGRLWTHWHPLLLVLDPAADIPTAWRGIGAWLDVQEVTLDNLAPVISALLRAKPWDDEASNSAGGGARLLMVPVLVFFGVATLVGCLFRGIVGLRLRAVARQPDVSDGELCQLKQANRITAVAVIASLVGLAVIGLAYVVF